MKAAILLIAIFLLSTLSISAQSKCLSKEEANKLIESFKTQTPVAENKKLRKELLDMREERQKLSDKISANMDKNQNLLPEFTQMGARHMARVCQLLKENGWLARELVRDDGFEAFLFIITSNKEIQSQQELLPVLSEAAKKGLMGNSMLAAMVDSIRVAARLPQIFGTQAAIRDNVVYLYPILNEEKVDEWRKQFDLPPLDFQIRSFEGRYLMPVLKSQRLSVPPNLQQKKNEKDKDTEVLGISDDDTEAIKVDTKLVNLNIRLLTQDFKVPVGVKLAKEDFAVEEDGVEQEISFFSTTEQPFDLVLLLDFSGSTVDKRGLIKKAAQRFVEIARPTDRIAVVAFATDTKIISGLTNDKSALKEKIDDIDINGGSPIWDSLKFVYANVLKEKTPGRRSAIVFMTDAEDGSMNTTFAEAIEIVRRGDTTVFPVYLGRQRGRGDFSERFIKKSQQSLWMLAEESGGQFYMANDVGDLKGIYEQVANELGQIYSIGYEPRNQTRDGGWRSLKVKIKTRPELVTRTRRGYYAN